MLKNDNKCYDSAINILSNREHSQLELTKKLQIKGFNDSDIKIVIDKLITLDYQSDKRFADSFVRSRVRQGKGKLLIALQLKSKGINDYDFNDYDFFSLCNQVQIKKFTTSPNNQVQKNKQILFLKNRGFSFDEINYAINTKNNYIS